MKFILNLVIAFFCVWLCQLSIKAEEIGMITLEDVVKYKYNHYGVDNVRFQEDGKSVVVMQDGMLLKCSIDDFAPSEILFDLKEAHGEKPKSFENYSITSDSNYILLEANRKSLYRHSAVSDYYLYDTKSKAMSLLTSNRMVECVKLSKDGKMAGYVYENDLYVVRFADKSEIRITNDGKHNSVINGKPDWVNEEEFSYDCAYDFSQDGRFIAWLRFDESNVRTYSFPIYKGMSPEFNENTIYTGLYEYKYPKAGEMNSTVSVYIYDIYNKECRKINVPLDSDGYIPRIQFTKENEKLAIVTLNRLQNLCNIYLADAVSGECSLLVSESNEKYVDTPFYESIDFSHDKFVLLSERDGFRHMYLYDKSGKCIRQLTKGEYEVKEYYGQDDEGNYYYVCNEGSPLEQYVCKVNENGERKILTEKKGVNSAYFDKKCRYFINKWSSLNTPPVFTMCDNNGGKICVLEDNNKLTKELKELKSCDVNIFHFSTSENVVLNGWMVKPHDFNKHKKYPVLMYQYSGPGNQQVLNSWDNGRYPGMIWEKRLAQKGYIVVCVDGRGTGGRGENWRNETFHHLGDKEAKDQVETALYLSSLPFVDKDRIAIWGWSYGGWNTLMAMSEGRPVFNCGIAVAPVSSYRFYDTIYTERYMGKPQENADAYDDNPMTRVDKLYGDVLLVHGFADDNVHFQNVAELTEVYVQNNVQFESQFYVNRNHQLLGGNTRMHLFSRIEKFLDKHIGESQK